MRNIVRCAVILAALVAVPRPAFANWDIFLFLGRAFPKSDDRLTFPLPPPSIPGVDVSVNGTPKLEADGGSAFGAAIAAEAGVVAIEGRLDAPKIGFDLTGAHYDLLATQPPFTGLTAAISLSDGRFEIDRLHLWSANIRVRTPGPVGIVASGGLTFMPDFSVSGSVPVALQGGPLVGDLATRLRLSVAPGESTNRTGVNVGGGLRVGGARVAVVAEARVFYFGEYTLQVVADDDLPVFNQLATSFDTVRFRPIIITAQGGLLFRF